MFNLELASLELRLGNSIGLSLELGLYPRSKVVVSVLEIRLLDAYHIFTSKYHSSLPLPRHVKHITNEQSGTTICQYVTQN